MEVRGAEKEYSIHIGASSISPEEILCAMNVLVVVHPE
jgi:hypothetical protein